MKCLNFFLYLKLKFPTRFRPLTSFRKNDLGVVKKKGKEGYGRPPYQVKKVLSGSAFGRTFTSRMSRKQERGKAADPSSEFGLVAPCV